MRCCPVDGEYGGFKELFVRVLLADILAGKIGFGELLKELFIPREQLFLCIARVIHEGIILTIRQVSHMIGTTGKSGMRCLRANHAPTPV